MPPEIPPVISKLYDLILWLMGQVPKFPRSHRFVLGDRIQTLVLDVLDLLKRASLELEKLRYLIRLSRDLNFLSVRRYQFVATQIDEVGRMVGGWLRQQKNR